MSRLLDAFASDEDAAVRSSAIDGLWEQDNTRVLRRLLTMLRSDPAPEVRTAVAQTLSRFANLAGLEELSDGPGSAPPRRTRRGRG